MLTSSNSRINIAITNYNRNAFIHLVRGFAVLYDRNGQNDFLNHTQVYLLDEDAKASFLIAGGNLKNTIVVHMKQETAKQVNSRWSNEFITSFLKNMLSLRPGKGKPDVIIEYVPFNLLLSHSDNSLSVFEVGVSYILESDVQGPDLGCLLNSTHMRIGSTIHADCFYEAAFLFSKSDYIRGFSWLLQKRIKEIYGTELSTEESPFLFVGYGVYSEMLLRELTT